MTIDLFGELKRVLEAMISNNGQEE